MNAKELTIDRLKRAQRLLDLVEASGTLADRHGPYWGDIDAASRVWAARALLLQAIEIQQKGLTPGQDLTQPGIAPPPGTRSGP